MDTIFFFTKPFAFKRSPRVQQMEVVCFQLPGHGDAALKNMNSLRSHQHFCDVTIVASGKQMFRGHKVVLAACSPFLRDQFLLSPSSELQVSVLHSSNVVCKLLQSCYTGTLQFSSREIVNYLTAASYLQMEHVVERCRGALSMYLQPKNPSPSESVKMDDLLSVPVMVSDSDHGSSSSSPQHDGLSPRPESPAAVSHALGSNHTSTPHQSALSLPEMKARQSGSSIEQEEDEDRGEYEAYKLCLKEHEQGAEPGHTQEEEQGEASIVLEDRCQETDMPIEDGTVETISRIGGFEREGLRWRRRLHEPRVSRGRGFKLRRRGSFRERRPLGVSYQEAWRFPTHAEIMSSLAVDFGSAYLAAQSHLDSPPRMEYTVGEGQEEIVGEEPSSEDVTARYGLDDSSIEGGMGVVAVPADEEGGADDSVAVVGSTSCASGPVACDHCGLAFPSAQSLVLHMRGAHFPYVCPCCGKQFTHASNLNRHMSVHRGAKAHRCPLCHKTFTQKATLCDHMNLHSGERPHRCAYCHVRFAHKPALRRHLKEQHGKTTAQNCLEAQRESEAGGGGDRGGGGI
ncbi:zinc finger and BTB domain-containing protein 12-like [Denticeps clupeoides]|uniref:Uncharacterized protein n=1 Tax=Denticeps clupeoides TaxID=299321 RepID=A0AAY4E7S1_9TELE|nr:zinc finger and BTB domain-containing protein 12-like [Denticeps clupeoides]